MTTRLYDFRFVYTDGSFYVGTVADNGSYGYYNGQVINTAGGYYAISATAGYTKKAAGTVSVAAYYDSTSGQSFKPTETALKKPDGVSGLGSESDSITGANGTLPFGNGGTYEAKQGSTLYTFTFTYNDGSSYTGTVSDNGTYGYYAGDTVAVAGTYGGSYDITGTAGNTNQVSGTVSVSSYYDVSTLGSYTPYYTSLGQADGSAGLGSESDATTGANGTVSFAGGGSAEALQGNALYDFTFTYNDSSYYTGTVADDGSYGYHIGETISANGTFGGTYTITAFAGGTTQAAGTVSVAYYYDASSGQVYTPYYAMLGSTDGPSGLGSEFDAITGANGMLSFGNGGAYEARQGTLLYSFAFTYSDGSFYTGTVADNGFYGYSVDETLTTVGPYGGTYQITGIVDSTQQAAGTVSTSTYFDASSGLYFTPDLTSLGLTEGSYGLGSETDTTTGTSGTLYFGGGGASEALQGTQLYNFTFAYNDGSYYTGTVAGNNTYGYYIGDAIATGGPYGGTYTLTGATGTTGQVAGMVAVSSYYDVTSGQTYTPTSAGQTDGSAGLGSEYDSTIGNQGTQAFGDGGTYEAAQDGTLYNFTFTYTTGGCHYSGTVSDNGYYGYYVGEAISATYGTYQITGTAGYTADPYGTVSVSSYYDSANGLSYTPYKTLQGKADGASGLGSEFDSIKGTHGYLAFYAAADWEPKPH